MTEYPGFGVLLRRLAEHRKLDVNELARLSCVAESELTAVLDGATASPSLLRRLAPAVNLHTADLFVIASMAVPEELTPLDSRAGTEMLRVVEIVMHLSSERGVELLRYAQAFPTGERSSQQPVTREYEQYPVNPGAVVVRMLANRNLKWTNSAQLILRLTGVYLSASTIGAIGHGRKELTPDLLAACAVLFDIAPGDLNALFGIDQVPPEFIPDVMATNLAALLWNCRRLTLGQVRQVRARAAALSPT